MFRGLLTWLVFLVMTPCCAIPGAIAKSFDIAVRDGREGIKDSRGVDLHHGFAERTTFIVTQDGLIAETIGGVSPMENVQKSLEAVQSRQ